MGENIKRTSVKAKLSRRISKAQSDYCIYLCSTTDFSNLPPSVKKTGQRAFITVTGTGLPAVDTVEIEYFGEWVKNPKYGLQFKADSYKYVDPTTKSGIKSFLESRAFPGVGPKTAAAIVDTFGENTLDVIRDTPQRLLVIEGITPNKLGAIITAYKKNESYNALAVFLYEYGIPTGSIVKINDRYGANAVERIKDNPYSIQDIKGIGFRTCDRIARGLGTALDSYDRIEGGIFEAINNHIARTGDTCMKAEDLENEALAILNAGIEPKPVNTEKFRTAATKMCGLGLLVFRAKKYAFTKAYDEAEELAAKRITELLSHDIPTTELSTVMAVADYRKRPNIKLSDKQAEAVIMALSYRVSIITGGPGTGKSTILAAIIACYQKLFRGEVTLMAPTGKAARRMTEATGIEASTIHSRIGLYDADAHFEPKDLPEGLIVVDESSMIDAILMAKLLQAVKSKNSHLLFVGDVDQLPSVGAGSILLDMIQSKVVPVAKLTEIFRQSGDSNIVTNAHAINTGDTHIKYGEDFEFLEASCEEEALDIIKRKYAEEVKTYGIDNVALLSPLRRSQEGRFCVVSDELNKELQDSINPRSGLDYCSFYNTEYRLGDRVLQWKNCQKSSNGDIGKITQIGVSSGDVAVEIQWDNGNTTIETRETMANISLAYAISIYKSQGSEYRSCIIPLLSVQDCALFKRNLVYTGVTRAKEKVILVGDVAALNRCIEKCDTTSRTTLFAERLVSEYKKTAH